MNMETLQLKKGRSTTRMLISALLLIVLLPCTLWAQQGRTISGAVSNEQQEPLQGVKVQVRGSDKATSTDDGGRFTLEVGPEDVLVFTYIGYETTERSVGQQTQLDVVMTESVSELDEVVVVGYGTVKKSSVTAAISKVENKNLDQMPAGRPERALVGRMAGVSISDARSTPGAAPIIRIRGAGSISASNDPLVVIDGFPGGSLANINMNDVQSIEVLKDASSSAIYGSRGAGGVILVTTKRGSGKARLNVDAYAGFSSPILHDDWLMGKEWYDYLVKYQNREFAWSGGDVSLPMYGDARRPVTYQVSPLTYELPQTNWQNEITQNAPIQNYNLSISGSKEDTKYYVSAAYKDEVGNVKTAGYKQYGLRANIDAKINDVVSMGAELSPNYNTRRIAGSDMVSLVKYPSFVPPVDETGKYPRTQDYIATGHSGQASPYTFLYGTNSNVKNFNNLARVFVNLKLLEGLTFNTSVGANINFNSTDYFRGGVGDDLVPTQGTASDYQSINLVNENTLNYTKTFGDRHDFTALLGASYQRQTSRSTTMGAVTGSYNNEIIQTLNNAIINPSATNSSKSQWGLVSYFGRINYAYDSRYLFAGSIRTDASSRFGPENKWALFPSLSAAWRVSEEDFFSGMGAINELKLRASYGVTGNFNIGDFAYLGQMSYVPYSPGNSLVNGHVISTLENRRLGWEKTHSYDVGLELGMFNSRIYLNVDLYNKNTTDLLYNVSVPGITGFTSTITNVGEVNNRGIEVELTTQNLTGAVNWQTSFNVTRNINKVVNLGDVSERIYNHSLGMSWILREGAPMFSYYGYKMDGIYQTEEQIAASPHLPGAKPGNPIIKDRNNDGRIDPQDKVILGNFQPKFMLGLANDFSWKSFDLSFIIQTSLGAKMFNLENQYYEGNTLGAMRRSLAANQWWSVDEPGDGKTPAAALSQLTQYNANTDYYVENASFLALRNVNIGYNFSDRVSKRLGMSRLRAYATMNNLLLIRSKENHSYNPEGFTGGEIDGINSIPGFNSGSEPVARIFALGVNASF